MATLIREHPDVTAAAQAQAGMALAGLGRWRQAAERYGAAREAGADPAAMDDRIWDACLAMQRDAAALYRSLCPDGRHNDEASRSAPGPAHKPDGGPSVFDAAAEALTRLGLRFSVIAGETKFMLPFGGGSANYVSYLRIDEERCFVLFYAMCPLVASENRRQAMAEFITRANYGLSIGNFELDLADGEIRFKAALDVEGSHLNEALLGPLVFASTHTMDRYLPGIIEVLYQDGEPAQVIDAIERRGDGA